MDSDQLVCTMQQVMIKLQCSRDTVMRMIKSGELVPIRRIDPETGKTLSYSRYTFLLSDVLALLEKRKAAAQELFARRKAAG